MTTQHGKMQQDWFMHDARRRRRKVAGDAGSIRKTKKGVVSELNLRRHQQRGTRQTDLDV
jgi:hypothetical protein